MSSAGLAEPVLPVAGEPGRPQRVALRKGPLLFEEHSTLSERVRNGGVEVHGPTHFDRMRATSYYTYDPDGSLLEFWSPDPEDAAKEAD